MNENVTGKSKLGQSLSVKLQPDGGGRILDIDWERIPYHVEQVQTEKEFIRAKAVSSVRVV